MLIASRRDNGALVQGALSEHPLFTTQQEVGQSSWFGFSLVLQKGIEMGRKALVRRPNVSRAKHFLKKRQALFQQTLQICAILRLGKKRRAFQLAQKSPRVSLNRWGVSTKKPEKGVGSILHNQMTVLNAHCFWPNSCDKATTSLRYHAPPLGRAKPNSFNTSARAASAKCCGV